MKYLFLIIGLFSLSLAAQEQTAKQAAALPFYTVDTMLNEFKANKKNTAEIALFRKIQFSGSISELPYPRKHGYLSRTIKHFSPQSHIIATKGITITSATGRPLALYIIDELAAGLNQHLVINDKVHFEAYHVYNSSIGPGLLVYSWQKQKQTQPGWFKQQITKLTELVNQFIKG